MTSTKRNVNETPTLAETMRQSIENLLVDIHTALPARVESFDGQKSMVSVQPLLKRKFRTETDAINLPIISNVPVIFPRTANAFIKMPIAKGDQGLIVFSERSLDKWLDSGGESISPDDPRKFDLSDAVFLPGLYTYTQTSIDPASNILIYNNKTQITIKPDGETIIDNTDAAALITLKASGEIELINEGSQQVIQTDGKFKFENIAEGEELITIIKDFMISIAAAKTNTVFGPQPLIDPQDPAFVLIQARLDKLKV